MPGNQDPLPVLSRLSRIGEIFLLTTLLFLGMNLIAWAFLSVLDLERLGWPLDLYPISSLKPGYPDLNEREIRDLLKETWLQRRYQYEPFTGFREAPFSGRYVRVTENGYRLNRDSPPWPPVPGDFTVMVFGGSTTFGYGVPDRDTLPSFLEERLSQLLPGRRVVVYNFGRGYYYSSQELVLFQRLLARGAIPDLALFVDGLNEFVYPDDQPKFSERLGDLMENPVTPGRIFLHLPLVRLYRNLKSRLPFPLFPKAAPAGKDYRDPRLLQSVLSRYLCNQRLLSSLAASCGVTIAFVWQPVPLYGYSLTYHPFIAPGEAFPFGNYTYAQAGYEMISSWRERPELGANFLWCADLQRDRHEQLYVDLCHYSGRLCSLLAGEIARQLQTKGLLPDHR